VRRAVMTSLIAVLLDSAAKSFARLAACLYRSWVPRSRYQ
jgi:hypothetical protein